ncbi:MAG TPA: hypothetical protein VND22_02915, partial [Actinomycetota bacterium]|nr:hypothetical protein [Actinomycetota bacterium]
MTISVVLVVIAIITLGFGWLTGKDPMIYTSIGASVLAGLLLIKSVLDERKARAAAALAGTSTLSDRTDYTSSLDAEPVTFEEESTQLAVTPIGGYADDEDVEPFEEEEERVPATVAAGGRSRAKS